LPGKDKVDGRCRRRVIRPKGPICTRRDMQPGHTCIIGAAPAQEGERSLTYGKGKTKGQSCTKRDMAEMRAIRAAPPLDDRRRTLAGTPATVIATRTASSHGICPASLLIRAFSVLVHGRATCGV
jgi:hypothetical protein